MPEGKSIDRGRTFAVKLIVRTMDKKGGHKTENKTECEQKKEILYDSAFLSADFGDTADLWGYAARLQ